MVHFSRKILILILPTKKINWTSTIRNSSICDRLKYLSLRASIRDENILSKNYSLKYLNEERRLDLAALLGHRTLPCITFYFRISLSISSRCFASKKKRNML